MQLSVLPKCRNAVQVVLGYLRNAKPDIVLTLANAVGAATAMQRGAGQNVADLSAVHRILMQGSRFSDDPGYAHQCWQALSILTDTSGDTLWLH